MDFDLACGDFHRFAFARQIIGALASDLDGRKLRRRLQDHPGIVGQNIADRLFVRALLGGIEHLAFQIVGRALLTPGDGKFVDFPTVHDVRHGFGGVAERDRQHAGGQRIERAGMARLLGIEQPLDLGNGLGGAKIERFVEDEPTGNRAALGFAVLLFAWFGHASVLFVVFFV
ncbi:hypothetical protein D3C78_1402380 [compost metagenome]